MRLGLQSLVSEPKVLDQLVSSTKGSLLALMVSPMDVKLCLLRVATIVARPVIMGT